VVGSDLAAAEALASLSIILIASHILASWLGVRKPFGKGKGCLNLLNPDD